MTSAARPANSALPAGDGRLREAFSTVASDVRGRYLLTDTPDGVEATGRQESRLI